MTKILDRLQEFLIPEQVPANGEELDFFFNRYKAQEEEDRNPRERQQQQVKPPRNAVRLQVRRAVT